LIIFGFISFLPHFLVLLLLAQRAHLPAKIADIAFDRVYDRVPLQYIKNAIASSVASKLVYREGTKFVQFVDEKALASTALKYLEKEKEVTSLRNILEETNMPESEKHKILELLEAGGARTLLTAKGLKYSQVK
jgi:glutamate dehydrogenase